MKYKCNLCGFIVSEEEFLIDGIYRCPICGVDKSQFSVYKEVLEEDKRVNVDKVNLSINRVFEKCINCGICKKICHGKVGMTEGICVGCGSCVLNCPTGALTPKYNYSEVFDEISNEEKIVVAFTAPSVRVGLGEFFGLSLGENVEAKMVGALRDIGFNYVLDTTIGADITIMEEVNELIERVNSKERLPMFTSCCSSWVKFVSVYYPEIVSNLSSVKSPNAIMGSLVKSYFADKMKINPKRIVTVGIVPCTSKKIEANRPDLCNDGFKNLDYILTTSEVAIMIREKGIDFNDVKESNFDSLLGSGSGAGYIFGTSGGVMEASIRTLSFMLTGSELNDVNITKIRGSEDFREATINIANREFKVAVIYGLSKVREILDKIINKELYYDFIEVMACDNGCVGGAGGALVNINKLGEAREARLNSLFSIDNKCDIKTSFENEEVKKIYEKFLNGVGSQKSHDLLHSKVEVIDKVNC